MKLEYTDMGGWGKITLSSVSGTHFVNVKFEIFTGHPVEMLGELDIQYAQHPGRGFFFFGHAIWHVES